MAPPTRFRHVAKVARPYCKKCVQQAPRADLLARLMPSRSIPPQQFSYDDILKFKNSTWRGGGRSQRENFSRRPLPLGGFPPSLAKVICVPWARGKPCEPNSEFGGSNRELSMPLTRTVTMLALARESLERFDNDADAAQAYLSERLVNDRQLREALVKSAIEYERREMEAPS